MKDPFTPAEHATMDRAVLQTACTVRSCGAQAGQPCTNLPAGEYHADRRFDTPEVVAILKSHGLMQEGH